MMMSVLHEAMCVLPENRHLDYPCCISTGLDMMTQMLSDKPAQNPQLSFLSTSTLRGHAVA